MEYRRVCPEHVRSQSIEIEGTPEQISLLRTLCDHLASTVVTGPSNRQEVGGTVQGVSGVGEAAIHCLAGKSAPVDDARQALDPPFRLRYPKGH